MVPKIIFKLHEPQHGKELNEQKETYIYMFFSYGFYHIIDEKGKKKKYIPLKYSTGKKVKPAHWLDRPVYRVRKGSTPDDFLINLKLDRLQDKIQDIYFEFERSGIIPSPIQLKDRLDVELKGMDKYPSKSFNEYIRQFITDAKNGKRLTREKTRYKPLSIKNLKGFQVQITEYQKTRNIILSYKHINVNFLTDFVEFYNQKGYSKNTIARHIKHLKLIMRSAKEEGLHDNRSYESRQFRVTQVKSGNVYLNEMEISRMYQLDLSGQPQMEIVRDVFLLGCYLAQHYHDYKRIGKTNVIKLDGGKTAVKITQIRTGKHVIVPLRPEAENILRKYDYKIPLTTERKINEKIKKIGKMAGITETVPITIKKGGKQFVKPVPKYQLLLTHTARRSGCTNMYMANIPSAEIIAISGHKTERELLMYIQNIKKELEIANKLSGHPFFSNPGLIHA